MTGHNKETCNAMASTSSTSSVIVPETPEGQETYSTGRFALPDHPMYTVCETPCDTPCDRKSIMKSTQLLNPVPNFLSSETPSEDSFCKALYDDWDKMSTFIQQPLLAKHLRIMESPKQRQSLPVPVVVKCSPRSPPPPGFVCDERSESLSPVPPTVPPTVPTKRYKRNSELRQRRKTLRPSQLLKTSASPTAVNSSKVIGNTKTEIANGSTRLKNDLAEIRSPLSPRSVSNSNSVKESALETKDREISKEQRESTDSKDSSSSCASENYDVEMEPIPEEKIFSGIVAFVEVRCPDIDCSSAIAYYLAQMGARITKTVGKRNTHLVFKDGRQSVYDRAKEYGVTIVSVLWMMDSMRQKKKLNEGDYRPIESEEYEDLVKFPGKKKRFIPLNPLSAEEYEKRAVRRIALQKRRLEKKVAEAARKIRLERIRAGDFDWEDENSSTKVDVTPQVFTPKPRTPIPDYLKGLPSLVHALHSVSPISPEALKRKPPPKGSEEEINTPLKQRLLFKFLTPDTSDRVSPRSVNKSRKREREEDTDLCITREARKRRKLLSPQDSRSWTCNAPDTPSTPVSIVTKTESTVVSPLSCTTGKVTQEKTVEPAQTNDKSDKSNSSAEFQKRTRVRSKIMLRKRLVTQPSIVYTSLKPEDTEKVKKAVQTLGVYCLRDNVKAHSSSKKGPTTHVVTGNSQRRTLNMLRGVSLGCWIVTMKWVEDSLEANRWLHEETYEAVDFSTAITKRREQRQKMVSEGKIPLQMNFENGPFYKSPFPMTICISRTCRSPPAETLEELVTWCGGKLTKSTKADVVVTESVHTVKKLNESQACVTPLWLLDSVQEQEVKPFSQYKLV